jgi:hypothetical protein
MGLFPKIFDKNSPLHVYGSGKYTEDIQELLSSSYFISDEDWHVDFHMILAPIRDPSDSMRVEMPTPSEMSIPKISWNAVRFVGLLHDRDFVLLSSLRQPLFHFTEIEGFNTGCCLTLGMRKYPDYFCRLLPRTMRNIQTHLLYICKPFSISIFGRDLEFQKSDMSMNISIRY